MASRARFTGNAGPILATAFDVKLSRNFGVGQPAHLAPWVEESLETVQGSATDPSGLVFKLKKKAVLRQVPHFSFMGILQKFTSVKKIDRPSIYNSETIVDMLFEHGFIIPAVSEGLRFYILITMAARTGKKFRRECR